MVIISWFALGGLTAVYIFKGMVFITNKKDSKNYWKTLCMYALYMPIISVLYLITLILGVYNGMKLATRLFVKGITAEE